MKQKNFGIRRTHLEDNHSHKPIKVFQGTHLNPKPHIPAVCHIKYCANGERLYLHLLDPYYLFIYFTWGVEHRIWCRKHGKRTSPFTARDIYFCNRLHACFTICNWKWSSFITSKVTKGIVLKIQRVNRQHPEMLQNMATKAKHWIRRDVTEQRSLWGLCLWIPQNDWFFPHTWMMWSSLVISIASWQCSNAVNTALHALKVANDSR